jgi:fructose-1-phosphate kinase PfkB-like protein
VLTAGGASGRCLVDVVTEEAVSTRVVPISESTRVATHWLSGFASRMLVSPNPALGRDALTRVFDIARSVTTSDDCILIGGSVHRDVIPEYVNLIRECCSERWVAVDVRLADALEIASAAPQVIRLPEGVSHRAALDLGAQLAISTSQEWVRVSTRTVSLQIHVPSQEPVNPFGCGDCLISILAALLREGREVESAAVTASAAAAANVLDPIPGRFHREDLESLKSQITVERLHATTI